MQLFVVIRVYALTMPSNARRPRHVGYFPLFTYTLWVGGIATSFRLLVCLPTLRRDLKNKVVGIYRYFICPLDADLLAIAAQKRQAVMVARRTKHV